MSGNNQSGPLESAPPSTSTTEPKAAYSPTLTARIVHASECQKRFCCYAFCMDLKETLHLRTCNDGRNCPISNCWPSQRVLRHWDACEASDCTICSPIRKNPIAACCPDDDD